MVASRAELYALGISRQSIDRATAKGQVIRVGRSALVEAHTWTNAQPSERHALRARAAMRVLRGRPLALSHHSALSVMGLPVYGVDDKVHLAHTHAGSHHRSGAWVRHPAVPGDWIIWRDQMPIVRASLASLQVADAFGVEAGLVSADAAMTAGSSAVDFQQALSVGRFGRGVTSARTVAAFADPRMESPGESRARWLMRVCGLPACEPQAWIRGPGGFAARVDFLFADHRTIVEFDGMLKYRSPDALRAEKIREDRLRKLGYEVVRLTWADLADPARVKRLILDAFGRAARSRAS